MCESVYGADRPLAITTFTDIVQVYSSGIAFIKRSPLVNVSLVQIRSSPQEDWQTLTSDSYLVDFDICQIAFKIRSGNSARITYTSGFDFTTTTQEVKNIKSICGRIVSYMNQKIGIGQGNITDAVGFQSFVATDSFLGIFLQPLAKYKVRG